MTQRSAMPDTSSILWVAAPVVGDGLGRTCLKMQRLAHGDPEVTALQESTPDGSGASHVRRPAAETLRSHGAT